MRDSAQLSPVVSLGGSGGGGKNTEQKRKKGMKAEILEEEEGF